MLLLPSLFAAIIPMLLYLILLWLMDKYDREPLRFVLLHFIWGAFGAVVLGILGSFLLTTLLNTFNKIPLGSSFYEAIISAPVSEEISKGIFLFYTVNSNKFDNITDGLVYGGAIGLGFGMTENFTYFISYGKNLEVWITLVILRSSFSAVMHCISTATLGAFLGIAKFSSNLLKFILPFIGILISISIHFIWNLLVSQDKTYSFGFLFMFVLIILFIVFFKFSIKKEKYIIENELYEESKLNLLPAEHINIISSNLRFKKGWIDEKIRKIYFRTAIGLAFNKIQYRTSTGMQKLFYENEIEKKRQLIKLLLTYHKVD